MRFYTFKFFKEKVYVETKSTLQDSLWSAYKEADKHVRESNGLIDDWWFILDI